jgi:two-component system chemotaxis response regulator CheB
LLAELPAELAAPVVIALHIPRDYTAALAQRLDGLSALSVVEASDGLVLEAGLVALAPGGHNLRVERVDGALVCRLAAPEGGLYVPSVDVLFRSAAVAARSRVLAVVLTGMGDDGLRGTRVSVDAGGRVVAEAESSCVVYGMPRCVREAGLVTEEAALADMAAVVARLAR